MPFVATTGAVCWFAPSVEIRALGATTPAVLTNAPRTPRRSSPRARRYPVALAPAAHAVPGPRAIGVASRTAPVLETRAASQVPDGVDQVTR